MTARKILVACLFSYLISVTAPASTDTCPPKMSRARRAMATLALLGAGVLGTVAVYEGPGWYRSYEAAREARRAEERRVAEEELAAKAEAERIEAETRAALARDQEIQREKRAAADAVARAIEVKNTLAPFVDANGAPYPQHSQVRLDADRVVFSLKRDLYLWDAKKKEYLFVGPPDLADNNDLQFLQVYNGTPFGVYLQTIDKDKGVSKLWILVLKTDGSRGTWHEINNGGRRTIFRHAEHTYIWDKDAGSVVRVYLGLNPDLAPDGFRLESLGITGVSEVTREGDDWLVKIGTQAPRKLSEILRK